MRRAGDQGPRAQVDVCVVTCRRPRALHRLLGGLQQLREPADFDLRVVVVDNDADESAGPVCAEARDWLRWPLHYATEKRRGIPQARNAALALSLPVADFVAFIDDDEVPHPDWLEQLFRTLLTSGADAAAGPALPVFESPPPAWIEESGLFAGPRFATGVSVPCAYTNNVLVRTRSLAALDSLFDEAMVQSGSSDSELFTRFVAEGHRVVWCDEARTEEWVPESRACLAWLLRRALRVGSTRTGCQRRARQPRSRTRIVAHGGWCIAKGLATGLVGLARSRGVAARGLFLAAVGVGRLLGLSGWSLQEYRTLHGG